MINIEAINKKIDYAVLKPNLTIKQLKEISEIAIEKKYASVCLLPQYSKPLNAIGDLDFWNCCVLDFPFGIGNMAAIEAVYNKVEGVVDEVDVVLPLWVIAAGNFDMLDKWCNTLRFNTKSSILKGIIEIGYWNESTVRKICNILIDNNFDFIKTCSGFGPRGCTVEDIDLLARISKHRIRIKASGGIKTYDMAYKLIEAGADRIGTSNIM